MKIGKSLILIIVVLSLSKAFFSKDAHASGFFGNVNQAPQNAGTLPPPIQGKIGSMNAYMTCSEELARSNNRNDFPLIEQCLLNSEKPQINFQKQLSISASTTWCNPGFQQAIHLAPADLFRVNNICRMARVAPIGSFGQTPMPGMLPPQIPGKIMAAKAYIACSQSLAKSTNPGDFPRIEQCLFSTEQPQPNFRMQLSMTARNTWCNISFQDRLKLTEGDLDRTDKVCQAIGVPLPDLCPYENGGNDTYAQENSFNGQN